MQRRIEDTVVIRTLVFLSAIIASDQFVKYIARTHPDWQGAFFRLSENAGIAFSMPLHRFFIWAIIIFAFALITIAMMRAMLHHRPHTLLHYAWILGGGISNVIDRFRFGAVIDTFILPGGFFFNLADVAILIGLILVLCPVTKHH